MAIFRVGLADGSVRLAVGAADSGPTALLPSELTLAGLLREGAAALHEAHRAGGDEPVTTVTRMLAPVDVQEVWASGVTYLRSRAARLEESQNSAYDRVYLADRPELFFKSRPEAVRGHEETVGIRVDSTWDVPEPELTVLFDGSGEIAAYANGNDMSSRSIEGENTLYLPQAKTYKWSCAIGPCLVMPDEVGHPADLAICLNIERAGVTVFEGESSTAAMKRSLTELRDWLFSANEFPDGVMLMTGTGIVPDSPFTLEEDDVVHVSIEQLGRLSNRVERVGRARSASVR